MKGYISIENVVNENDDIKMGAIYKLTAIKVILNENENDVQQQYIFDFHVNESRIEQKMDIQTFVQLN